MVPSSLLIGCRPPARSTIDSRRAPIARPGSTWICSSSGPRCAIAPVIASSREAENSRRPVRSIAPAIPHISKPFPRNPFGRIIPRGLFDSPPTGLARDTINYSIARSNEDDRLPSGRFPALVRLFAFVDLDRVHAPRSPNPGSPWRCPNPEIETAELELLISPSAGETGAEAGHDDRSRRFQLGLAHGQGPVAQ